jgi:hypothetical protein
MRVCIVVVLIQSKTLMEKQQPSRDQILSEAIRDLNKHSLRPLDLLELLAFGATYRDLPSKLKIPPHYRWDRFGNQRHHGIRVMALGSQFDPEWNENLGFPSKVVPQLVYWADHQHGLRLSNLDYLEETDYFAAVWKLGSSPVCWAEVAANEEAKHPTVLLPEIYRK